VSEFDGTSERLIDQAINAVIAARATGVTALAPESAPTAIGECAALVAELSKLNEMDWPADEVGDKIALRTASASGSAGRVRGWSRWLAVGAAAAVALAAGAIQLLGPTGLRTHVARRADVRSDLARSPNATANGGTPESLTAMAIVSRPGAMRAVGAVSSSDDFLTCVTRTACYMLGTTKDGHADIAKSQDGGASWSAGESLPALPATDWPWDASLSCRAALTCVTGYGSSMLVTSDGFAHYRIQPVAVPGRQVLLASCPTALSCVAAMLNRNRSEAFSYSGDGGMSWATASAPPIRVSQHVVQLRCDRAGACIALLVGGTSADVQVNAAFSADAGRTWQEPQRWHSLGNQQWLRAACGSARECLVSGNNGNLGWIQVSGTHVSVRILAFPKGWLPGAAALSCATGRDCFVQTMQSSGYGGNTIEATRDGGRTWTAIATPDPAVYLSCPVASGCVALAAGDSTGPFIVLSNLRS